jgi:homoserine acetyltransferase
MAAFLALLAFLQTVGVHVERVGVPPPNGVKVLYVLSRSDVLFPPSRAPEVLAALRDAGVDARYVEIDSEYGHLASGADAAKWAPALRSFIRELSSQ